MIDKQITPPPPTDPKDWIEYQAMANGLPHWDRFVTDMSNGVARAMITFLVFRPPALTLDVVEGQWSWYFTPGLVKGKGVDRPGSGSV